MWEIQLKVHILIHFLHLKSSEPLFPEHIQKYSISIFLLQEELDEQFQDIKLWNQNICCLFSFEGEKWGGSKKIGKWNLQSSTDLNQNFLIQNFKIFILTCLKKKNSLLMNFRFRMTGTFWSRFAISDFYFSFKRHI